MLNKFKKFLAQEEGAVTVDWVMLTAAIVGLSIAVFGTMADGTEDLTNALGSELSSRSIGTSFTDF